MSVVKAIAASGLRSRSNRFNSSAEKCWASAAEPPFPQAIILFLDCRAEDINWIAFVSDSTRTDFESSLVWMLLVKCDVILAWRFIEFALPFVLKL